MDMIEQAIRENSLVGAFAFVGLVMWLSIHLSRRLTFGRVHGSAIAIVIGLALAYWGGIQTGGSKGIADLELFAGIGLMGGAMMRDFAIVATAFEVHVDEARRAGLIGAVALLLGTLIPFAVGASVAWSLGYTDAVAMTTIGAGAVTYIVGPVTGAAIGASSDLMALSIATGLIKAIMVMVFTPAAARFIFAHRRLRLAVLGGQSLVAPAARPGAGPGRCPGGQCRCRHQPLEGSHPARFACRRPPRGRHLPYRHCPTDQPIVLP
jgi:malonate transporter MadM subunit